METTPPREFGVPPGQTVTKSNTTNIETTFFTKIGTRVGAITAFYEHLSGGNTKNSFTVNNNYQLPEPNYPPPQAPKVTFSELGTAHSAEVLYEIPKSTKINGRK